METRGNSRKLRHNTSSSEDKKGDDNGVSKRPRIEKETDIDLRKSKAVNRKIVKLSDIVENDFRRRYVEYLRDKKLRDVKFVPDNTWAEGLIKTVCHKDESINKLMMTLDHFSEGTIDDFAEQYYRLTYNAFSSLRHNMEKNMKNRYHSK